MESETEAHGGADHLVALRDLLRERETLRALLDDVQAAIDWRLEELRRSEGGA